MIVGRVEATFRALRRRKGPQLLGYLRRVASRDRISARRIEDQGRLARDNRFVIRRVVISEYFLWKRFRELLEPFQHFLDFIVALDGNIAIFVDEIGAVGLEHGTGHTDRIGAGAEAQAHEMATLCAFLGCGQEGIPGPTIAQLHVGLHARWTVHPLHFDPGQYLHVVDARARRQRTAPVTAWYRHPVTVDLAGIFAADGNRAVLGDHLVHDVVHRHE